jgi:riboflavin kinase/FMN adenylyltransferase
MDQEILSVTNIGTAPTFKREARIAETHLLDFSESIYGAEVQVHLFHKIRDEVRFQNLEELKRQISKDVSLAKEFFKNQ